MTVALSANSWHRKLQLFTFGADFKKYSNFCPYFWTTLLCLLVSPFVGLLKGTAKIGKVTLGTASDALINRLIGPTTDLLLKRKALKLDEATLYKLLWITENASSLPWVVVDKAIRLLEAWKTLTPGWTERLYNIGSKFDGVEFDFKAFWPKFKAYKAPMSERTKSKILCGIYGSIFGVAAAASVPHYGLLTVLWFSGSLIGGFVVVFAGIYFLCGIADAGRLDGIGRLVSTPFQFLSAFIRSFKQNHCPAIDWVD